MNPQSSVQTNWSNN